MYVLLILSVIEIFRRGGLVYVERIGIDFLEEIGGEVLRRSMKEEIYYRLRKLYVFLLGYNVCGREGLVRCMVGRS